MKKRRLPQNKMAQKVTKKKVVKRVAKRIARQRPSVGVSISGGQTYAGIIAGRDVIMHVSPEPAITSPPHKKPKIFISSTMIDLQDMRDAVAHSIVQLGYIPLRAETSSAQPISPRETILQLVHESDILLGIYSTRYGFVPENETISITEMEFDVAKQL